MTETASTGRPVLLVLASTYPRWAGDPEPGFVHELSRRLTHRFEVIALVPSSPGAPVEERRDGVTVLRFRYAPRRFETLVNDGGIIGNLGRDPWKWLLVPFFAAGQLLAALLAVRRYRPDAIHAHWLLPQGLVAAMLGMLPGLRLPFLVTSHGADLFALRAAPLVWLKRLVARRAASMTVVSKAMIAEMQRIGIDSGSVRVLPMGVDLEGRFTPDATVARSTDEILFVGRLVEKKGLRHLIDALPAILAQRPSARLLVAGFGPGEAVARAQVDALGLGHAVDFLGAVGQADLPLLYRRACVFVAPFIESATGDREGLGLVVVEAAGCGCPVVVSDLPAVRDVFPDSAPAAWTKPGDAGDIAAKVCRVMGQAAPLAASRETLIERFDWVRVAARYADLLTTLLPRLPGPRP